MKHKKHIYFPCILKKLTFLLSMTGIILGSSSSSGLPLVPVTPDQGEGNAVTPVTEQKPGVLRKILRGTSQFISKLSSDVHEVPIMDMTTGTMYRPTFPKSASCEDILNELNTLIPGGCNILFYQDEQADRMYAPNSTFTKDPTHNKKDKPLEYIQQATLMVGKKEDQDDYWGELRLCCLRALLQLEECINNSHLYFQEKRGDRFALRSMSNADAEELSGLFYSSSAPWSNADPNKAREETLRCIHTFKKACKQKGVRMQILNFKQCILVLDKEARFTASLTVPSIKPSLLEMLNPWFVEFLDAPGRTYLDYANLDQFESGLRILPEYSLSLQQSSSWFARYSRKIRCNSRYRYSCPYLYTMQKGCYGHRDTWSRTRGYRPMGLLSTYKSRYDYDFDINKISDIKVEIRDLAYNNIVLKRHYNNRVDLADKLYSDLVPHLERMTGGRSTRCALVYEDHGILFSLGLAPGQDFVAVKPALHLSRWSVPTSQKQINFTLIVLNSDR